MKQRIKYIINKLFPITDIKVDEHGEEHKTRDLFYMFRMANVEIKDFLSKIDKQIKSFLPQYGWITFLIIILIILLLSIKFKKNIVWDLLIYILSIRGISGWFEAFGTFVVAFLAVHPIHQKTNIGFDTIFDTKNVGVQLLSRDDSSTFVKLQHVYICDENRTKQCTIFGDLNIYFTQYTRWIPLTAHTCNMFWIVKNNDAYRFEDMYPVYSSLRRLGIDSNMHYIEFIFSVNDHCYDMVSDAIDVDKIYNAFCKND